MSMRFSQALEKTYNIVRAQTWHTKLQSVTILRDAKGQIHLFLEGYSPNESERNQLSQTLGSVDGLGPYWTRDIWVPRSGSIPPVAELSSMVREHRTPGPWGTEGQGPTWYLLERHVAKQAWTEKPRDPGHPWPLGEVNDGRAPAVVAFFSFKGGLGRTTVAAATGLILARHRHRVALVDLDLEAPGLASLFLSPRDDRSGVIDYLIDSAGRLAVKGDSARHYRPFADRIGGCNPPIAPGR